MPWPAGPTPDGPPRAPTPLQLLPIHGHFANFVVAMDMRLAGSGWAGKVGLAQRLRSSAELRVVVVVLPLAMHGKPGMKAEVLAEPPWLGRYLDTVVIVERVVDSANGTFGVRLDLPNPKGEISAGVKCRVLFPP